MDYGALWVHATPSDPLKETTVRKKAEMVTIGNPLEGARGA